MPKTTKVLTRPPLLGTGRFRPSLMSPVGPAMGILRDTGAPEGTSGPLSGEAPRFHFRVTGPGPRASWRLPGAGWRLRKPPKVTWGRHSRPLFAKYRGDLGTPLPRSLSSLRGASSSERALPSLLRCAKRAPCAFTETAIKRAIRGAGAAGVTPGRIVVTREGFVIEFGASGSIPAPIAAAADDDDDDDDEGDVFAKLDRVSD